MIRPSRFVLLAATCLVVTGCGATTTQLKTRAKHDLGCGSVSLTKIDSRTYGVSGCGQRATYIESCQSVDAYGGRYGCTWVMNVVSQSHAGAGPSSGTRPSGERQGRDAPSKGRIGLLRGTPHGRSQSGPEGFYLQATNAKGLPRMDLVLRYRGEALVLRNCRVAMFQYGKKNFLRNGTYHTERIDSGFEERLKVQLEEDLFEEMVAAPHATIDACGSKIEIRDEFRQTAASDPAPTLGLQLILSGFEIEVWGRPSEPVDQVSLRLKAGRGNRLTPDCTLQLLANGKAVALESADAQGGKDHLELKVTLAELTSLASAQRVVGMACSKRFQLDAEHLGLLQTFLMRYAEERQFSAGTAPAESTDQPSSGFDQTL